MENCILLVGTHAVIEEAVKFKNLGLVIIDEQHRFGVAQRAKLWKKATISAACFGNDGNAYSTHIGNDSLWRFGL